MPKYNVRYEIVGGSHGNITIDAESSAEARRNVKSKLESANKNKVIIIKEVIKK